MNITVRVLTPGAQAELAKVKAQLAAVQAQLAAASRMEGPGSGRQLSALTRYGNQLQWTGRQLQYNFTLPIVLAGAAATKFAMDNERAFTRVKKVYGDAGMSSAILTNETNALKKAFVALSNHYGVHQKEVLNIAADWAAAGASGVALARGVEQTLKVMVLGEMEAGEATNALIAIQAQYNLSSGQLIETIAKLNVVENQTGVSLQGLIQGFARAAGTARSAGIDVDHLAAMMAALVPTAGTAAQAGNGLKTIISRLQAPTGEARDILERMGFVIDGVGWKSANGAQKIEMLAAKFQKLAPAQRDVVASTIASGYQINKFNTLMDQVNAYLAKSTKHTNYYGKALQGAGDRAYYMKQAETELQKVLESNPQKFKQIWVILENAMADIIVPMIPLILMAASTIKNLVEAFRSLPLEVQKAITLGLLFLALFGPLLRYIGSTMTLIGELAWFFGRLARSLLVVLAPFKAIVPALKSVGSAYMALRGVMLGVTAALLSGSRVWSGVLTAIFGAKAAGNIIKGAKAVDAGFKMIHRGIIAFFINLVPFIFLVMGKVERAAIFVAARVWRTWWTAIYAIGPALAVAWRAIAITSSVIAAEMAAGIAAAWRFLGVVLPRSLAAAGPGLAAAWRGIIALSQAGALAAAGLAGIAWRAGLLAITVFQLAWSVGIAGAWRALSIGLSVLTAELMAVLAALWLRGLRAIQAITIGFAAVSGVMWRSFAAVAQAGLLMAAALAGVAWRAGLTIITAIQVAWTYGFMALWRVLSVGLAVLTAELWSAIRVIFIRGLAAVQRVMLAGAAITGAIWRSLMAGIAAITVAGGKVIPLIWRGMLAAIVVIQNLFSRATFAWLGRLITMLRTGTLAAMAAMTGPWGIAITAVVLLLVAFHKQIAQAIRNIIKYFQNIPKGVSDSFNPLVKIFHSAVNAVIRGFNALPKGVRDALIAVVRIVAAAVRKVYELFSYLNPFAHHSPSLVENVTKGMAEVRKQFGSVTDISGPIKQAYNDIKRFGQATAGLMAGNDAAKRAGDRANLAKFAPGALDEYDAMIRNLKVLTPLLALLGDAVKRQQSVVNGLKTSLDAANATLDKANKKLDDLQKIADKASASLDEAKQRLSDYASTPIQGMKAMSDQIFANEMAQKKLRLEMMKMEDAVGGMDKLQDKLNNIQGEIELLSGTQADLRAGGAGSEILKQYDDQIKGLEDQQNSIKDTASEYQKLSDELEKLQRQGEKMDLENSLAFDPLTRQIEAAANAMKEMPFDEIMAGVQQANADIAKYTTEVDKANAAVNAQKAVVDAATAARDALQARYDAESAKLDILKDKYSQVETAIQDINSALQDMTTAAEDSIRRQQEALDKAKGGAAGGGGSNALDNFNGAAGGNFPDVGGAGSLGREGAGDQSKLIDQFTQDLAKETGKMFEQFDIFGPIKRKWAQFTGWWSSTVNPAFASAGRGIATIWTDTVGAVDWTAPFKGVEWGKAFGNVKDIVKDAMKTAAEWGKNVWKLFADDIKKIWDTIKQKFKEAIDKIRPEFESFKKEIEPASEALKHIWSYAKIVAGILGGILLGALKLITSVLSNTVGPAFDAIIAVIKGFIRIIKGIVQIIIGIFTGDLGKIKEGVLSILNGLWTAVWGVLKGAVEVFLGIIKGLVEGVVDFFKWLLDVLVGHSIIPDMVKDIIDWIASLPGKAWDALKDLGSKIIEVVKAAWDWWVKTNTEAWDKIWTWFSGLAQKTWDALKELAGKLKSRATEAWDAFKKAASDKWDAIVGWIKTLGAAAANGIHDIVAKLKQKGTDAFNNFKLGASIIWDNITGWIKGLGGKAASSISDIVDKLKSKGTDAMNGMKNGLTGAWDSVKTWLGGIGDRVKSSIGNLANLLKDAGRSILEGFLKGLKEKWEDVKGFIQGIAPWTDANKGPIQKDRKLLVRHGAAILIGFQKGMKDEWPSVQTFVKSMAPAIAGAFGNSAPAWGPSPLKGMSTGILPGGIGHAEARVNRAESRTAPTVYHTEKHETHLHFHGDLSFPNVKTADDADRFISHLESLAGGDN